MPAQSSTPNGSVTAGVADLSRSEVTVLLVDDQERFRRALRELIGCAPGLAVVGEASSGEQAVRAVARLAPQLVLMDVVMPGMGGVAAARTIMSRRPTPMVVLISVDDPSVHPEAGELGRTVPYVLKQELKPSRLRELWDARQRSAGTRGDARGRFAGIGRDAKRPE
jgi:DNA-binding NarL/FixJ family response regulator